MEKNNLVPQWLSIVLLLVCAASVFLNIFQLITDGGNTDVLGILSYVFYTITVLCISCYALFGFNKFAAKYFQVSLAFYLATNFIAILNPVSVLSAGLNAIIFGCLSILLVAKDLGRAKSFILGLIVLICSIVIVIYTIMFIGLELGLGYIISNIILPVMLCLIIFAKYNNKYARGSK